MRVIHINQQDGGFGAYIAARRLHCELVRQGNDSRIWVLSKTTRDPAVRPLFGPNPLGQIVWRLMNLWNCRSLRGFPGKPVYGWAASELSLGVARRINRAKPDFVVLHQTDCILSHDEIERIDAPVLWAFHDMYPFTGDCHHSFGCDGYARRCGCCPQLGSNREDDPSRRGWERKSRAWNRKQRITGVAPSRWICDCAKNSSLCADKSLRVIPNGIPLDIFTDSGRLEARAAAGFDDGGFYILAGAASLSNNLKGFDIAVEAVKILSSQYGHKHGNIKLVTFGAAPPELSGIETTNMGFIRDEAKMAALLRACDLYVHPTAADTLPTVLIESIACGTPCVAVPVGGCADIVRDGGTGFVAETRDAEAVAAACGRVLAMPRAERLALRASCRAAAEAEYGVELMARRYLEAALLSEEDLK